MSPDKSLQARWSRVEADVSRTLRTARTEHDRDVRFARAGPASLDSQPMPSRSGHSQELDFKIKLMKA
jgi:hypothetical protein